MNLPSVTVLANRLLLTLILGFAVAVLWRLFTLGIGLNGLLQDDKGEFSPGRAQMLMVTLITAMQYLAQVIQKPTAFPEIPQVWLAGLGASHGIYLVGKARSILFGKGTNPS